MPLIDLRTASSGLRARRVGEGLALDAARVARVAVHHLALGLVGGEYHLRGVDHDHVVAGVEVRGEDRLVLAPRSPGHLTGHAAEHHALGVDDEPAALDLGGFRGVGGRATTSWRLSGWWRGARASGRAGRRTSVASIPVAAKVDLVGIEAIRAAGRG